MKEKYDDQQLFQMENTLFEQFDLVDLFAQFFHYQKATTLDDFCSEDFLQFCWDINVHCLYGFQRTNTEQWIEFYNQNKHHFLKYFNSCDDYLMEQISEVVGDFEDQYQFTSIEQLVEDAVNNIDLIELLVSYVLEQYYFVTEIVDV